MRKHVKTLSLILALMLCATLFSACAGSPEEASGEKDSLIFSINADIVSMDCHMARDTVTGIVHYQV